jgi:aminotransferase
MAHDETQNRAVTAPNRWTSARASSVPPSKIRRMFNLAERLPAVVNLAVGQPDFATPQHIVAAAKAATDAGHTRYTNALGLIELRQAIAEKVNAENGMHADSDWVAVTVGAMEGLLLTMMATLDPGDEVLIPNPGYTNFVGQVILAGANPVFYPLRSPDFQIEVEGLRRHITNRTRAILLCSPANPTGAVLSRESLEAVSSLARERDIMVYSDETYEALVYDGVHLSIGSFPGMADRTVSVFSFSKAYAMTGWRVGYVVAPPDLIHTMNVLQEHIVSCASSVSQHAALAALRGPQDCILEMRAIYNQRRRYIVEALNQLEGVVCPLPGGAFYVFAGISRLCTSSDAFADWLLEDAGVATVPGTAFNSGGEGFLRISFAASMETLHDAVGRIGEAIPRRPFHV